MKNARVRVNPRELGRPLDTLQARFGSSFCLEVVDIPEDVSAVFVRVFRAAADAYFDCPATQNDNGDWNCYIIGTTFPDVGEAAYEIHATDSDGNPTSLGAGKVRIEPFSAGSSPITQGSEVSVATLPDETGALHQVVAINLGTAAEPDWTWQVRTINGAQ